MKALKLLGHAAGTLLAVFLLAVLPICTHFDLLGAQAAGPADATTGASLQLPDQPSGNFIVLINTRLHEDTLEDWEAFFRDEDFTVIFEDVHCLAAEGDITGLQLAQRFQAQLPENQMTVRTENPTLLVSKAEAGAVDVAVFSQEMADALALAEKIPGVSRLVLEGGES